MTSLRKPTIPYLKKGADLHQDKKISNDLSCLNNACNVIISKAEKDQICGKPFIPLPSHMVNNARCLTGRKQLSDMNVLY